MRISSKITLLIGGIGGFIFSILSFFGVLTYIIGNSSVFVVVLLLAVISGLLLIRLDDILLSLEYRVSVVLLSSFILAACSLITASRDPLYVLPNFGDVVSNTILISFILLLGGIVKYSVTIAWVLSIPYQIYMWRVLKSGDYLKVIYLSEEDGFVLFNNKTGLYLQHAALRLRKIAYGDLQTAVVFEDLKELATNLRLVNTDWYSIIDWQ